jgi:predicted lipoprotein with Yx(FWY)xxD motif
MSIAQILRSALVLIIPVLLTAGGSVSAADPTVSVASTPQLGPILVNAQGFTLYHLTTESAGHIVCTGTCATIWPPLLLPAGSPTAGPGVTGTLGVVQRPDGRRQVTYNGWPLYTYSGDKSPGQTNGQGIRGIWFAVTVATTPRTSRTPVPSAMPTTGGAAQGSGSQLPMLPLLVALGLLLVGALTRLVPRTHHL